MSYRRTLTAKGAKSVGKIKVAIIGVGNCASSLVQGIHKYVEIPEDVDISGVMHNTIGGYRIEDIEVVAAFDIDANKVGQCLDQTFSVCQRNLPWSKVRGEYPLYRSARPSAHLQV